jgi:hypothetical protein
MIRATVRWVPPPERYQQLVKRARELDPKVIVGVCSKAEIERMEREIDRLEKQAKEKEQNQPSTRAYAAFSDLWQRYWKAYNEVLQVQESMRPCRRELEIIGTPERYFQAPKAIPGQMPSFDTAKTRETFTSTFAHEVADIELLARDIETHVRLWVQLTPEAQNRKLILALAERLK